ncbi:type IV secretion system protein [Altererythrobacter sp. MF3-039]|uniref:type IV secretion system protein n=1 Tax=Altererythrobacter sp. MF3-039 TaxID=3252901 RepID=UPI00390CC99C
MSAACDQAAAEVGTGVGAALRAVDCTAAEMTASAFGRLFASGGTLGTALTILLTLFIAFFAITLLLGRTNLSVRSLTPRMITLGLVLTFATSWIAYQSVVWNLASGAPDQLATILAGSGESATQTFAAKIDVVFLAIQEATQGEQDFSAFSPPGLMWLGAMLFLLGTVGVLVTAKIALAVLIAIGPVFVVMALFGGTRGLFTGWLKGLVMLAVVPIFVVLGGSLMLELAVPILAALTATPGMIDPQAAMAFFMIGAVHAALMVMMLKVAGTIVAGWSVFGLVPDKQIAGTGQAASSPTGHASSAVQPLNSSPAQASTGRAIPAAAMASAPPAANDSGSAADTRRSGAVWRASTPDLARSNPGAAPSRAHGIGNRFRPANTPRTEKFT